MRAATTTSSTARANAFRHATAYPQIVRMVSPIDPRIAHLLKAQGGAASLSQLNDAGVTRGEVRGQLDADRWQRPSRGVVLAHNGEPTPTQALMTALLACPAETAVSGPTAAALDGYVLRDPVVPPDARVHLTIPCGFSGPSGLGATLHWSRFLTPTDVHPAREPRRTRLPRSVVDWASWQQPDDERRTRAIVLGVVQQQLVTPDQLRAHLARRAHCRHRRLIAESIDDAEGGVASVPEHDYATLVREWGLPRPTRQVVRHRPNGRAYLDVAWEEFNYFSEIEGAQHFWVGTRGDDLMRLNDLVIDGNRVLQFTSFDVRRRRVLVAETTARALRSAGWRG